MLQRWKLTPEVPKINGLSVGIQQLNNRVVTLIDLAADGCNFSFNHCHVFRKQILSIAFKKRRKKFPSIKTQLTGSIKIRNKKQIRKQTQWESPGGPVVRTSCFHCQRLGFNPWSGNQDPASRVTKKDDRHSSNICQGLHAFLRSPQNESIKLRQIQGQNTKPGINVLPEVTMPMFQPLIQCLFLWCVCQRGKEGSEY